MNTPFLPVRCPDCDKVWDHLPPTDANVIFNEIHSPCPQHR